MLTGDELRLEVGEGEHGTAERARVALRWKVGPDFREYLGTGEEPSARLAEFGRSVVGGLLHGVNATRGMSRGSRAADGGRALGLRLDIE